MSLFGERRVVGSLSRAVEDGFRYPKIPGCAHARSGSHGSAALSTRRRGRRVGARPQCQQSQLIPRRPANRNGADATTLTIDPSRWPLAPASMHAR